jgi:DNA-binding transcriptional MerR regulator
MRLCEAAEAAGVSRQTVEYYIMLGLVAPIRAAGRRGRLFDDELVKRIRLIRHMNETGYTLRDIREIYLKGR